jgi:alkylation response protein AidB-like acyl-CoA dehydrogenase
MHPQPPVVHREFDLRLEPEHAALRETAHQFAATVLRPAASAVDRLADPADAIGERSPFWRALRQAYRLGYHRAPISRELGGLGLGGLEYHLLLEELGWGSADLALTIAVAGLPFVTVAGTGNVALIDAFVRPFVEDVEAHHIGCWAITEAGHGSDTLMLGMPEFHDVRISGDLVARRDRDYYVMSGQKSAWIANGTIATHALVFLTLDPAKGMAGGGVALVPLHRSGVSRGKPLDKMGQRALNQGELIFDEVRIHESEMLTDPTLYEFMLDRAIARANVVMAAVFTGVARAAYEAAFDHTRERVQGGKRLCEHQVVQQRLFEMFTRVEACRALSRTAMMHHEATLPPATEYAIAARVFCTEAALEVTSSALQLFGGKGLTREAPIEKLFRDARAALLEHGSNDVLALVAARRLLDRATGVPHAAAER